MENDGISEEKKSFYEITLLHIPQSYVLETNMTPEFRMFRTFESKFPDPKPNTYLILGLRSIRELQGSYTLGSVNVSCDHSLFPLYLLRMYISFFPVFFLLSNYTSNKLVIFLTIQFELCAGDSLILGTTNRFAWKNCTKREMLSGCPKYKVNDKVVGVNKSLSWDAPRI